MASRITCTSISPLTDWPRVTGILHRRVIEREKLAITADRDRQLNALRTHEHELHSLQLRLSDVNGKLRDKSALEKRIAEMKQEVEGISTRLKVSNRATRVLGTADVDHTDFRIEDRRIRVCGAEV